MSRALGGLLWAFLLWNAGAIIRYAWKGWRR